MKSGTSITVLIYRIKRRSIFDTSTWYKASGLKWHEDYIVWL